MKPRFWLERWQNNQISFHQTVHNPWLQEFWPQLQLDDAARVFVPLCGKSMDMQWLADRGHTVLGVELAQLAVEGFFADRDSWQRSVDQFVSYQSGNVEILLGDFFDLNASLLEGVAGVFDRGALVALPRDMRARYVDHILRVLPEGCRILLLTLEYDQTFVAGPPHAVFDDEVHALYGDRCDIRLVDAIVTDNLPPHFETQGVRRAVESIYVITKHD